MTDATPGPDAGLPDPCFESDDHRFRLYQGDCLELMPRMPEATFDLIFADPPYFLSNGGITCHAGRMVSVNKGKWDQSQGAQADHEFTRHWLGQCQRLLKPNGSIWVSGTAHIIHSVGYAMQCLGFKLLNDITWVKPNPPPNLSCRYFTHATETVIWAGRDRKCRHKFNYALMKRLNGGKQMTSVWPIQAPRREEKVFGKHPTQKSLALLERIIAAASDEGDLVLDPFCGSGTTGIAATRGNRLFCGVEQDWSYVHLAVLRFEGVPQADSPERILDVLRASTETRRGQHDGHSAPDVTERQIHYYRQAAAVLGLLDRGQNGWALTAAGRECLRNDRDGARRLLARQIIAAPVVKAALAAIRKCKNREAQRTAVQDLLARATALAPATCSRRAQTLMSWISWVQDQRSDGLIPSSTHEVDNPAVA